MPSNEKPYTFRYSKEKAGWTWELLSSNGTQVAVGAVPYAARWVARRTALKLLTVKDAGYSEVDTSSYRFPFTIDQGEKK